MSLFKWSTPERQKADQTLPIIPNEIYLCIFEHIAPPVGRLIPEQRRIYTHLSRVCRFFANFCLPRIFEFVEFSGAVFRNDKPTWYYNDTAYKTSRESTLCTQIAAKQPLALALAKTVRTCHFTNWQHCDTGSWAVKLFANKYLAGMSHMRNIRELAFFRSFVDAEHWDAIVALPSLEELSFHLCQFLKGPADLEPAKRVRVKPSRLSMVGSTGFRQPLAAIDVRYLRALTTDTLFFKLVDSLPQSLEALALLIDDSLELDLVPWMLYELVWKNLTLLQSFTLRIRTLNPIEVLSSVVEGVGFHIHLQSFTLKSFGITPEISFAEVRRVLEDKLGPSASLKYVDIYGRVLRLVDGEWSEYGPAECSFSDKLLCF